eukprot:jgi/Orpsp1_1/1190276/evm.model.d7180000077905.1
MKENIIGKYSDFFELGGDSFNAIRVISSIEKMLKIKLNIKDILSKSIICDLAKYIEKLIENNENNNKVEIIEKRFLNEFPITSQQLGVYIDSIKNPNSIIYNMPISMNLKKDIDIEKLKDSFIKIFNSHQILKSKYIEKEIDGKFEIYGIIDHERILKFENYTHNNSNNFIRPFDLCNDTLIRVGFIEENHEKILLVDMHHIISDGVSISIIAKELNNYYYDNVNNEEINSSKIEFSDYAYYINEQKKSENYEKQFSFYKDMFSSKYETLGISKIENKTESEDYNNNNNNFINKYKISIDVSLTKLIRKYLKINGLSETVFFITIYGFVLSKYSNRNKIYTSILCSNRKSHYIENMIGMFVTTLPLLLNYSNDCESLNEVIKANMENIVNIYNYEDYSFTELKKKLNLKNIDNAFIYQPKSLMGNMVNSENTVFLNINQRNDDELNSNNIINNSKFNILFSVLESEDEYSVIIEYNSSLYEDYVINQIGNSFIEVIKNIYKFDSKINEIEYIPRSEKEKVINTFNNNNHWDDCERLYHVEFSKMAKKCPEKCAIVYNDLKLTYNELEFMSNSLANDLRKFGINRNDIVPIISTRSYYYIIAILGISKAGGTFLPIDGKLPNDRINFMLNDINPKLILHYEYDDIIENISKKYNTKNLKEHNYKLNNTSINNINEPDDTCYMLFTSGTTGRPKGALVKHFNIYNFIRKFENNHLCYYDIFNNNDIMNVLSISNFWFDLSIIEILLSLIHGLKIVFVDDILSNNVELLSDYIIKTNAEYINMPPTRFKLFMENKQFREALKYVKAVCFIGEVLPFNLCEYISQYSNCKIYNSYGPTECSVTCTLKEININLNDKINIGKPLCNCHIYILDNYLKPVPIGIVGEIFICGYGVGKGYYNRDELTNKHFMKCSFVDGNDSHNRIMYKTGDLGKWNKHGELECLGRNDFQVKIHGQRIELSEVENIIKELQNIEYCVVIDKLNKDNDKYLVGYYKSKSSITGKEIREFLKQKLPLYMIPSYFVEIDEIPLTGNGKLNRKALPEPNINNLIENQYIKPETEIEKKLCKIYSEIFNIDENIIGTNSNFYELGGNSLNAIRIIAQIKKNFNVNITINSIMNNENIKDLAFYIENNCNTNENNYVNKEIKRSHETEFPMTSLLYGLFLDKNNLNIESLQHSRSHVWQFYILNENVDIIKLKNSLKTIINRHQILKSTFIIKEINGENKIYGRLNESDNNDDDINFEIEKYNKKNFNEFIRPYDMTKNLLIRACILENKILVIDMDHKISDGYSFTVLKNELNKIYNNEKLDDLPIQYSDYAAYYDENENSEYILN